MRALRCRSPIHPILDLSHQRTGSANRQNPVSGSSDCDGAGLLNHSKEVWDFFSSVTLLSSIPPSTIGPFPFPGWSKQNSSRTSRKVRVDLVKRSYDWQATGYHLTMSST